ncbi:MAG TPA: sialidase family protein [Bryobacterales bacterium]|jgi:predicted neuraminidase|nr:sialidase family protein [Bryobacterales bacterium]
MKRRFLAGAFLAVPWWVLAQRAPKAFDYSKELASPDDGRFRPSPLPGIEEAYLPPLFASSHAANLLLLKSGDLLCFWFSGSREGESDVAIVMARLPKGSAQWSRPQLVDHRPGASHQNPVPFEAPDGVLWLFHTTQPAGEGQANARVLATKSRDGGKTWTAAETLFDVPGAFVRQPLLLMPDGRWMLPMYFTPSRGITTGAETNYSEIKISADHGGRWTSCAIPNSNGYVQPNVLRVAGGRYVAFFRSRFADYIYRSDSSDGCTWTAPRRTELPNNNASIQVAQLRNGHLVMAFNNARSEASGGRPRTAPRKPLSVALSEDGGETWSFVRDIETGALRPGERPAEGIPDDQPGREEFSYPSVAQTADGRICVAYTYRRYTIKTVRFAEDWIKQGTTIGLFRPRSAK